MKYKILKKDYDILIFELINFVFVFRLKGYVDHLTIEHLDKTIELLRYYRQFEN